MEKFWGFLRKTLNILETSMAAGGELDDAVAIESRHSGQKNR